jgi:tellurite resistance protein
MEFIVVIIIFVVGSWVIGALIAGAKSAVTGNSFQESYSGMADWTMKIENETIEGENNVSFDLMLIKAKGLIPISYATNLSVIVNVLDITDENNKLPLISSIGDLKEPRSTVFMLKNDLGRFEHNTGFTKWVEMGRVIPMFLQPPYSGERKLGVNFFLYNTNNPIEIRHGFLTEKLGLIAFKQFELYHDFDIKGYMEKSDDVDRARALSVQIAMAVAMSDGSLADEEGDTIKNWIKATISSFSKDRKNELKNIYNTALKDSYKLAQNNKLILSNLTSSLKDFNEVQINYDTIDLCYKVMAADGVADPDELRIIRKIGESLDIDVSELDKMKDKSLMSLSNEATKNTSIEEILGIEKSWDKLKIKQHLTTEFQKWNNRMNALKEGDDRNNAQLMLNKIADARKKYDT